MGFRFVFPTWCPVLRFIFLFNHFLAVRVRNNCKMFAGSVASAVRFWRLKRVFFCVMILVATCALSIVVVVTNQTQTYSNEFESVESPFHYDNSRRYVIQDSVFMGDGWPSLNDDRLSSAVCLATQASVEKFHYVIDSGIHWRGPMSVALFTPGVDHQVGVIYLQYLKRCFEDVMQNMTIHWVFPIEHPPDVTPIFSSFPIHTFDCSRRKEVLEQLLQKRPSTMMSWRQWLHYPQNMMRNVARKSCTSNYVILTDVDIVPSPGMCQVLSALVATKPVKKCRCCVFVIPTYEIETDGTLPGNKKELLKMVAKKEARSFRRIVHKRNQAATNVSAWETLPNNGSTIASIAFQLPHFRFGYEPFYMSKDSVPPHDERFVGYGHTRNTQVYEMQIAGYKFFVLDNVFLVHLGMAQKIFNSSKRRQKEVYASYKLSQKFLSELQVKYSNLVKMKLKNIPLPVC